MQSFFSVAVYLPPIVDKHVVHLEVCFFATLLILELDEGVLQAVAGLSIANHFTTENSRIAFILNKNSKALFTN